MSDTHPTSPPALDRAAMAVPASIREEALHLRMGDGAVPPQQLSEWQARTGASIEELMTGLLALAATMAYAPVSSFRVGCVVHAQVDGPASALFLGANFEFPGAPLSASVHAEQAAVNRAAVKGARAVSSLAVTAAPCGHCRQFLSEVKAVGPSIHVLTPERDGPLSQLLPDAFQSSALGVDTQVLGTLPHDLRVEEKDDDSLRQAAVDAAARSYVPYSLCPSGAALELEDGRTVVGLACENAAYNPSISPIQSAFAVLGSPRDQPRVTRAVLVESEGAISHHSRDADLLALVAPRVRLERVVVGVQGDREPPSR